MYTLFHCRESECIAEGWLTHGIVSRHLSSLLQSLRLCRKNPRGLCSGVVHLLLPAQTFPVIRQGMYCNQQRPEQGHVTRMRCLRADSDD